MQLSRAAFTLRDPHREDSSLTFLCHIAVVIVSVALAKGLLLN